MQDQGVPIVDNDVTLRQKESYSSADDTQNCGDDDKGESGVEITGTEVKVGFDISCVDDGSQDDEHS